MRESERKKPVAGKRIWVRKLEGHKTSQALLGLLVVCLFWTLVFWYGATRYTHHAIEADVALSVSRALAFSGFGHLKAEVVGRNVKLSGTVDSQADKVRALTVATMARCSGVPFVDSDYQWTDSARFRCVKGADARQIIVKSPGAPAKEHRNDQYTASEMDGSASR